jgi:DNA end-binding protein Ku
MASLKDTRRLVQDLTTRARDLEQALEDDVDFARVSALADEVGAAADKVAATFAEVGELLERAVTGDGGGGGSGGGPSEQSKEDLLARAREIDLPGRSRMSKEELSQALDDPTKEQLYAWAQEADIPGRSEMSKEELAEALGRG